MRLANRPAASARLGGSPSRVVYRARFSRSERRFGGAKSWTATLRFQSSGRFRHPRICQYAKLFGLSRLARLFTSSCVLTSASCGLAKWITRPLWRRETGAVSTNLVDKTRSALWKSGVAARNSPEYASGRLNQANQPVVGATPETPLTAASTDRPHHHRAIP